MILRRLVNGIKNQDWLVVAVEIFVVVVGIFFGLQVDDWSKVQQDRKTEQLYLHELLEDLENDSQLLEDKTGASERILAGLIGLLEQSAQETPSWTLQEMNEGFQLVQSTPTFIPTDRAFINITGSGDLKIIRNRKLKNALAVYYSAAEKTILIQNTHEMGLVQNLQPYIIENMDYQAVHYSRIDDFPLPPSLDEDKILDVLHTQEFRNIVTQKWVIMSDLLSQFREMRIRNDAVIEILEAELGVKSPETQEPDQQ